MTGYRKVFVALLAAMLILSLGIGFGLSELILRPVRVIQATAKSDRSDTLKERIPVGEVKDELSQLAGFLNQMFDRLETSFSEICRFTADASHELKTPLALVRLHAERLLVNGNLEAARRSRSRTSWKSLPASTALSTTCSSFPAPTPRRLRFMWRNENRWRSCRPSPRMRARSPSITDNISRIRTRAVAP